MTNKREKVSRTRRNCRLPSMAYGHAGWSEDHPATTKYTCSCWGEALTPLFRGLEIAPSRRSFLTITGNAFGHEQCHGERSRTMTIDAAMPQKWRCHTKNLYEIVGRYELSLPERNWFGCWYDAITYWFSMQCGFLSNSDLFSRAHFLRQSYFVSISATVLSL